MEGHVAGCAILRTKPRAKGHCANGAACDLDVILFVGTVGDIDEASPDDGGINMFELRVDAWKLVNMYQRVRPGGAQDIGTWQTVFAIMSGAAVVTNGALLVFTMDTFDALPGDAMYDKAWLFLVFQYVMFGLMFLLALLVDDVPEGVAMMPELSTTA